LAECVFRFLLALPDPRDVNEAAMRKVRACVSERGGRGG
jgi:hypothetical protein